MIRSNHFTSQVEAVTIGGGLYASAVAARALQQSWARQAAQREADRQRAAVDPVFHALLEKQQQQMLVLIKSVAVLVAIWLAVAACCSWLEQRKQDERMKREVAWMIAHPTPGQIKLQKNWDIQRKAFADRIARLSDHGRKAHVR